MIPAIDPNCCLSNYSKNKGDSNNAALLSAIIPDRMTGLLRRPAQEMTTTFIRLVCSSSTDSGSSETHRLLNLRGARNLKRPCRALVRAVILMSALELYWKYWLQYGDGTNDLKLSKTLGNLVPPFLDPICQIKFQYAQQDQTWSLYWNCIGRSGSSNSPKTFEEGGANLSDVAVETSTAGEGSSQLYALKHCDAGLQAAAFADLGKS